jgi:hypothetical protein
MDPDDDDPIMERYGATKRSDGEETDASSAADGAVAYVRRYVLKPWYILRRLWSVSVGRLFGGDDDRTSGDASRRKTDEADGKPPSNGWHKAVALSTFGWVFLVLSVNSLSDAVFGLLFLTVWFLLPLGIYYDARRLGSQGYAPPSYWWLYVPVSFVWFVSIPAGFVYLLLRRRG